MSARISQGPLATSAASLERLKSTIDASAMTTPQAARRATRSRRMTTAMRTVMAGEIEITGKIRYAGPMVSALKSSSWPPAPVRPTMSP